jgi:peptide deformylase
MAETMYAAPGVGLAATQIGEPLQLFLSFPGATEEVDRAEKVTVRALDRAGKSFELSAEGLLAVAVQHEFDHLQGKLMIDYLGPLKKRILHRKMQKRADDV